jgi:exopolysaccharide biosynthesis polyprenyl glycosylphosphotransferase
MNMPIGIIENTTWAEASPAPRPIPLRVRPFSVARPRGVFFAAELVLLVAAMAQAIGTHTTFEVPVLIVLCGIALHVRGLDKSIASHDASLFWSHLLESLGWGLCAGILTLNAAPALGSRPWAAVVGVLLAGLMPIGLRPLLLHLITQKKLVEDVLIVGNGRLAEKLHQALDAVGMQKSRGRLGAVTDFSRLPAMLLKERISRVIVAEQDLQNRTKLAAQLVTPRLCGLQVCDAIDFYEDFFGKIWIDALSSEWIVYTTGFRQSKVTDVVKRCVDVCFALGMLTLSAPILLVVAIAIRLDSAGPILFRQERVGLHGKPFTILKLRSMRQDAEFHRGPTWASVCDDRVTRIGRLLRKFYLDEIPQAINVLRGEMSVVGPRPERPYFVGQLTEEIPFYSLRHCVKPGITGWAQVKYRYGASVEDASEKLQYDLYYAKHRSCLRDALILFKTVDIVLFGKGR